MPNGLQKGNAADLKNTVLFVKTRALVSAASVWMALKFGDGSMNWTINKNYQPMMNRGRLDDIRRGDDALLDVTFDGKYTFALSNYAGDGSGPEENYTLHEILEGVEYGIQDHGEPKFQGTRESWLADYGCPPYCCELELHNNPALDCPDTTAIGEAKLFRYFRATSIQVSYDTGMCNVSGQCHILRPMVMRCAGPLGTSPAGYPKFAYSKESDAAPFTTWPDDPRAL